MLLWLNLVLLVEKELPDVLYFDRVFTVPYFGYKNLEDYHYQVSACHRIPQIATPTFFLNALDDPVVPPDCIDFDSIRQNKHTFLGTTQYGGHLGYKTSVFSSENWLIEAVLAFFDS